MANLRRLKKNIKALCGDLSCESVVTSTFVEGADEKSLAEVVIKAAKLQTGTLSKVNVVFDKTPRDFANRAEYRKAKREYFKKAYDSLDGLFIKEAESLIAQMNKAIPKKEAGKNKE